MRLSIYFVLLFLSIGSAFALNVDTPLSDAVQEARAQNLFHQIRCVVCQSEAIADSPAEVARDMRRTVRELVTNGKSDAEIKDYLVQQYGDHILMQPPFKPSTALLWLAPVLVLCAAALIARRCFT